MVLPGPHLQPVVLYRGGRGHGVPPRAAEPLHRLPQLGVAGQRPQRVEHVVQPRPAQPVQQGARSTPASSAAGCPRRAARGRTPPCACSSSGTPAHCGCRPRPGCSSIHCRLPMMAAVRRSGPPAGIERLVHVQGDRERAVDAGHIDRGATEEHRLLLPGGDRRLDPRLRTAQVRQAVNVLGKVSHTPPRQPGFCAARAKARGLQALLWCSAPADPGGQDVTDADHPGEAPALQDGEVPEPVRQHQVGRLLDCGVGSGRNRVPRHPPRNR